MRSRLVIPAAILVAVAYVKGRQDAQPFAAARPAAPPPAPAAPEPTPESILRAQAEAADAWEMGLEELAESDLAVAEAAAAAVAEPPAAEVELAEPEFAEPEFAEPEFAEPEFADVEFADAAIAAEWVDQPLVEEPVAEEPAVAPPAPAPLWIPGFEAAMVPEAAPSVFTPRAPAWEPDPVALSEWSGTPVGAAPHVEASGRFALGGWAVQAGHMALCGVTFPERIAGDIQAGRIRLVPDALENVSANGLVVLGDAGFAPDGEGFTLLVAASAPGAFAVSGRYEVIAGSAG